jgi:hypothetical protein
MKVKEPLYVLSCTVFLYLLAGSCLAALIRRLRENREIEALSFKVGAVATVGLLLGVAAAFAVHIQPDKLTRGFVLVHSVTMAAMLGIIILSQRKRSGVTLERGLYAAGAVAIVATFTHNWTIRTPRDQAIARLIMPYLEQNSPTALSFVASNFKSYQFYSFRRGCYWRELPLRASPATVLDSNPLQSVRVFIVDPVDERKPEFAPWLRWLEAHTTEKTRNLALPRESSSAVRVFVREP